MHLFFTVLLFSYSAVRPQVWNKLSVSVNVTTVPMSTSTESMLLSVLSAPSFTTGLLCCGWIQGPEGETEGEGGEG